MKANELMIGDWVYSTFSDKPCQVLGMELYAETGYANVKVTNVIGAKDINSLSPIPLTEDVLEKFGLIRDSNYWYIRINDRFVLNKLTERPYSYSVDVMNRYDINTFCVIENVNELQHILNMLCINKEIEL